MSEAAATIGQTLRSAREAQGLGVEEVAGRLRLMQRQVVAIEADDFASLGQPVFARGFVRNYAKLLDLPADELTARMSGDTAETAVVSKAPPPPARSWLSSPWLILGLLGLLLLVAAPVGLYLWLNSGDDPEAAQPFYVLPADAARAPAAQASAEPVQPAASSGPAQAAESDISTPSLPPPAPVSPPAELPAAFAPREAARPATPPAPAEAAAPSRVMQFEFGGESWVEIRDGTGRMVHRQLNIPGSQVEVTGQPPFDLVVGNAAQVRMTYNGRPIDLRPYIEVTVARFTLEE